MINKIVECIAKELAKYLDIVADIEGPASGKIEINHLFNSTGETIPQFMGITVVNIEEERINKANLPYQKTAKGFVKVNPEIRLNVFVLFTANYQASYTESLKFISYIIRFFQSKNVFTKENTPDLDKSVEKLIVELQPMSFEQQNYLWGMIGGKYLPSALYKFRLLVVQENIPIDSVDEISKIKDEYNSI